MTPPSTSKCGCDSTYFLVPFHLFSLCLSSLLDFMVSTNIFARQRTVVVLAFISFQMNGIWCKPAACYMYLDACNILSAFTDRLLSQRLLFVLDTIAVIAIIRYLCSVCASFMMCTNNNVQITVRYFIFFKSHFAVSNFQVFMIWDNVSQFRSMLSSRYEFGFIKIEPNWIEFEQYWNK